jgi:UDP-N-acetylglucosamine 1-carboxyvinyltransferase
MTIRGGSLLGSNTPYTTVPDRLETGSFLLLGALSAQELTIRNCVPEHIESLISMLRESGVRMDVGTSEITVRAPEAKPAAGASSPYVSFNVRTHEYPGFPTDLQPQIGVFLTQAAGTSIIFETIFEGRFGYAEDLRKMGADVTAMNSRELMIRGPKALHAPDDAIVDARDIRAGFAMIMAALVASGETTIQNAKFIDRGYEDIEEVLRALGADVRKA